MSVCVSHLYEFCAGNKTVSLQRRSMRFPFWDLEMMTQYLRSCTGDASAMREEMPWKVQSPSMNQQTSYSTI